MQAPHQPPGAISDPFSSKAFSSRADRPDQDGQHDGGFLYKQAGRDTLPSPVKTVSLSVAVVQCSFSVSQSHTCSRALKPRAGPLVREWRLHPLEVAQIWDRFGRAEVDLFASRANTHCPLFFSITDRNTPLGMDALAHMAQHAAVCISPGGNDFVCSGEGAPAGALPDPGGSSLAGEVVVCRDNQSAGGKALAAPSSQGPPLTGGRRGDSPTPRAVATTCLPVERSNLIAQGLHPNVVATIQSARASSTRGLYAYKWWAFEQWCQDRNVLPFQCSIV